MELRSESTLFPQHAPLEVLRRRVLEAAVWVERHCDVEDQVGSLRQLWSAVSALDMVSSQPGDSVRAVVEARAKQLGELVGACPPGRVVLLDPAETLSDGAAELESQGFFDVDNVPPCDSWIGLIQRDGDQRPVLLSWVPEMLVEQTERALWANPESCLQWLVAADPDLAAALRVG